jgi:hypothetical protein
MGKQSDLEKKIGELSTWKGKSEGVTWNQSAEAQE